MRFNLIKDNIVVSGLGQINKVDPTVYSPDPAIATSFLGTPVYSNLTIRAGSFVDPVNGQTIKYPDLRIDTVLFDVNREKNIVVTDVQGRDGSIKEYIGNRDFQIGMNGVLVSNLINVAPVDLKAVLIAICNAKTSLEVTSQFLNDLGIFNIVISNYRFAERAGSHSTIDFSLQAISDIPYDLEISLEQ